MTRKISDTDKTIQTMVPLMLSLMVSGMLEQMTISSLRDLLQREPMPLEYLYYRLELEQWAQASWWWELDRWWQEIQASFDKIHNFVWDVRTQPQDRPFSQLEDLIEKWKGKGS
jgi:hypothetical protein